MKFCPHCGQHLGDIGVFCASCGARVREAPPSVDETRPRGGEVASTAEQTMVRGTAVGQPAVSPDSSDDTVLRPPTTYGGTDWSAASAPPIGEMAAAPTTPGPVGATQSPHPGTHEPTPDSTGNVPTGEPPTTVPSGTVTPAPGAVNLDFSWLVRGNWLGAAATALVAVLIAFVASGALILISDPPEMSVDDKLTAIASGTAAIATVDVVASYGNNGGQREAEGSVGAVPLSIALLAFGGAAWVFRRLTRTYPGFGYAVGDAARTGLIFGVMLLVLSLVFRGDDQASVNNFFYVSEDSSFDYGPNRASALFLGFLVMFVVLVAASFLRPDWLGRRARRAHDFLAAPLAGLGAFLALLPVAGTVGIAAFWLTADNVDRVNSEVDLGDRIALWISSVGNVGLGFIGLGGGGRLGGSYSAQGIDPDDGDRFNEHDAEFRRLSWIIDETGADALWLAVPILFIVLAVSTRVVINRSRRTEGTPMANLLVWFGVMFVSVPLLGRLLSAQGSGQIEWRVGADGAHVEAEGYAGLKPGDSLLLPLIAVLVGLLIAAMHGVIDVRGIAANLQQSPAAAGSRPSGGPSTGEPSSYAPDEEPSPPSDPWGRPPAN